MKYLTKRLQSKVWRATEPKDTIRDHQNTTLIGSCCLCCFEFPAYLQHTLWIFVAGPHFASVIAQRLREGEEPSVRIAVPALMFWVLNSFDMYWQYSVIFLILHVLSRTDLLLTWWLGVQMDLTYQCQVPKLIKHDGNMMAFYVLWVPQC